MPTELFPVPAAIVRSAHGIAEARLSAMQPEPVEHAEAAFSQALEDAAGEAASGCPHRRLRALVDPKTLRRLCRAAGFRRGVRVGAVDALAAAMVLRRSAREAESDAAQRTVALLAGAAQGGLLGRLSGMLGWPEGPAAAAARRLQPARRCRRPVPLAVGAAAGPLLSQADASGAFAAAACVGWWGELRQLLAMAERSAADSERSFLAAKASAVGTVALLGEVLARRAARDVAMFAAAPQL